MPNAPRDYSFCNDYLSCNVIFLSLKRIVYLLLDQSIAHTTRLTHARRRSTSKFTSAYLHAHVCRVLSSSWSITRPTSVERVFCAPSKDIRVESSSPRRAQKCRIGFFRLCDVYRCKLVSRAHRIKILLKIYEDPSSLRHSRLIPWAFFFLHILALLFREGNLKYAEFSARWCKLIRQIVIPLHRLE